MNCRDPDVRMDAAGPNRMQRYEKGGTLQRPAFGIIIF